MKLGKEPCKRSKHSLALTHDQEEFVFLLVRVENLITHGALDRGLKKVLLH